MSRTALAVRFAFGLGGARALVNVLNFVSILVLARLLTPTDFGIVAISATVLSIIMTATELSLYSALVQRDTADRAHIDTAWTMALARAVVIFGVVAIAAVPLAAAYGDQGLIPVLIVSGLSGAMMGLHNPLLVLEMKNMRSWPFAAFQIMGKVIGFGATIGLALTLHSYWSIIIGNAVGAVLASLASYFIIPYRPRIDLRHAREIWGFSGWLSLKQIIETISWRIDQLALSFMVPRAQLGLYSVADNLAVIPTREALTPLNQVMFAGLAGMKNDPSRLTSAYVRAQTMVALVCMPIGVGVALVAEPVVRIALGEQWLDCTPFVQVLSLAYALTGLTPFTESLALALGRTRIAFVRQLWNLMFRVPLVLIGLFVAGAFGAALAGVAGALVRLAIDLLLVRRMIGVSIRDQLRPHATMVAGLVAMTAAILLAIPQLRPLGEGLAILYLGVLTAIGGLAYVAAVLLFWLLDRDSNEAISTMVNLVRQFLRSKMAKLLPG